MALNDRFSVRVILTNNGSITVEKKATRGQE
jgi:hypothetical protein